MAEEQKSFFVSLRSLLATGGISEEEYQAIIPDIRKRNLQIVTSLLALCSVIFLVLSFVCLLGIGLEDNFGIYLVLFACSLVLLLAGVLALRGRINGNFLPFVVLLAGFAYGIVLGTHNATDLPSVTFMVLLMGLPLLVIERPIRIVWLILAASAAMIIAALTLKTGQAAMLDVVDTVSFALLSVFANTVLTRSQIVEMLHRHQAEKDRDVDALTGLRNSHYYHVAASDLEHSVANGTLTEYGLVVADVNNLKTMNDTHGHAAGDRLICAAGRLLCDVFVHSPVMRIGGDEFLVILKGHDYKNREELLALFDKKMSESRVSYEGADCPLSVAKGVGIYDASQEMRFADVLRRADMAMYENKTAMKAAQ